MRKLFIGTTLTSLLGALVIGGVLAWTGSVSGSDTATAGTVAIAFHNYTPTGNAVYPTDGNTLVANTGFTNNTGVNVAPNLGNPGTASVTGATGVCGIGDFNTPTTNGVGNGSAVTPGNWSADNAFNIFVNMKSTAEDGCQTQTISYNVTINVTT